jgi:hypothetical protein
VLWIENLLTSKSNYCISANITDYTVQSHFTSHTAYRLCACGKCTTGIPNTNYFLWRLIQICLNYYVSSLRETQPNVTAKNSVAQHYYFNRRVIRSPPNNSDTIRIFIHNSNLLPTHHFSYFISALRMSSLSVAEPPTQILTFLIPINKYTQIVTDSL